MPEGSDGRCGELCGERKITKRSVAASRDERLNAAKMGGRGAFPSFKEHSWQTLPLKDVARPISILISISSSIQKCPSDQTGMDGPVISPPVSRKYSLPIHPSHKLPTPSSQAEPEGLFLFSQLPRGPGNPKTAEDETRRRMTQIERTTKRNLDSSAKECKHQTISSIVAWHGMP